MQQTSLCPRGPFCAFAHVDSEFSNGKTLLLIQSGNTSHCSNLEFSIPIGKLWTEKSGEGRVLIGSLFVFAEEMSAVREVGSDATNLATILSNVLPQSPSPGANKPVSSQLAFINTNRSMRADT